MNIIPHPKNYEELCLEYARCILMCREFNYPTPSHCVRYLGSKCTYDEMGFTLPSDHYVFALTILDKKPIFIKDIIYHKSDNTCFQIESLNENNEVFLSPYKYHNLPRKILIENLPEFCINETKPKKYFYLNKEKLVAPSNTGVYPCHFFDLGEYYFDEHADAKKFTNMIKNILNDAMEETWENGKSIQEVTSKL